jgi:hypothetical protein
MGRYQQYSAQVLTPLRENPPCAEPPTRSEAYGHAPRIGVRGGAADSGWVSCTACGKQSRGELYLGHGSDARTPDRIRSARGRDLRQRHVPVAM